MSARGNFDAETASHRLLARKLPRRGEDSEEVDISGDVALKYYRIQQSGEGAIELEGSGTVSGPHEVGTGAKEEVEIELSRLIDVLNERFGTEFDEADQLFFEQAVVEMKADASIRQAALANSEDNFRFPAKKKLESVLIDRHEDNAKLVNRILSDPQFGKAAIELILRRVYVEVRGEACGSATRGLKRLDVRR